MKVVVAESVEIIISNLEAIIVQLQLQLQATKLHKDTAFCDMCQSLSNHLTIASNKKQRTDVSDDDDEIIITFLIIYYGKVILSFFLVWLWTHARRHTVVIHLNYKDDA